MDSKQLSLPKMEDMNEFDWSFLEKQTQGILDEKSAFSGSHNYNMNSSVEVDQWQNLCFNNPINTHFEFMNGFEEFGGEIFLSDNVNMNSSFFLDFPLIDAKPLSSYLDTNFDLHSDNVQNVSIEKNFDWEAKISRQSGRSSKSAALELDEINKYFDVPITKAAKELKVGLTVLKKRCRELNIMRWPHRKIKSLKSLIHSVKELGMTTEIEMLEEHRRMLEKLPELELTERTKKLRQACFKANYKKRRSLQALTY